MTPRFSIFNMFGPSPLGPIETHMDRVHACVEQLVPFFKAVMAKKWEEAKTIHKQISELEKEADVLKQDLRLHLHKDLFLPVPRGDLLTMLAMQDRIANKAKDIAGLVLGRKMNIPDEISPAYVKLLERCIEASSQARKAINELDDLLESGFRGNEVKLVKAMICKLGKIERDTDEQQIKVRKKLFDLEKKLSPVDIMFLYKIIEYTGDLADRAETVGGQLQLLLAH